MKRTGPLIFATVLALGGCAVVPVDERSYGYEQPGAACAGEPCRRKMRRVDLLYPKPRAERRLGEQKR